MIYPHRENMRTKKTSKEYSRIKEELTCFENNVYRPFTEALSAIDFNAGNTADFERAAQVIDEYYQEVEGFERRHRIRSQSKFRSTILEELNTHLFIRHPMVVALELKFYNKNIYAGLKLSNDASPTVITKDVDFCIGKTFPLSIGETSIDLNIPLVCVECKTYLDATMYNEVSFSNKQLRNANPDASLYVIMERNEVAEEKIIASRTDTPLTEMFVVRGSDQKLSGAALFEYYREIDDKLNSIGHVRHIKTPGRLLNLYK